MAWLCLAYVAKLEQIQRTLPSAMTAVVVFVWDYEVGSEINCHETQTGKTKIG